jgi:hypothetical protein
LPTKTVYAILICPTRATCPAYLILLELIALILSGEGNFTYHRSLAPCYLQQTNGLKCYCSG